MFNTWSSPQSQVLTAVPLGYERSSLTPHVAVGVLPAHEPAELHLGSNLGAYERLVAHEKAANLGLGHVSVGAGAERHILITRL